MPTRLESGQRLLGLCYLNLKNNALAISALTRAVQLKSTTAATYIGLGQAHFNMQKYDECLQALNQGEPFLANLKQGRKHKAISSINCAAPRICACKNPRRLWRTSQRRFAQAVPIGPTFYS